MSIARGDAEALLDALGRAERAALLADVLAHAEHPVVELHLVVEGRVDRLEVGELGHLLPPVRREHALEHLARIGRRIGVGLCDGLGDLVLDPATDLIEPRCRHPALGR